MGESLKRQGDEIVGRLATAGITTQPDREIVAMIAYLQRLGKDGKTFIKPAVEPAAATALAAP